VKEEKIKQNKNHHNIDVLKKNQNQIENKKLKNEIKNILSQP
jgi:hypothetical protein